MVYYTGLVIMTACGALAAYLLKGASSRASLIAMLSDARLYLGGLLYFLTALVNIWLLRHLDLSVVLPFTGLTYLWSMILAWRFLNESISARKIAGLALIIGGVILIAGS